jgi:(p)ppGpp synthase/HD superfamily hydrolase
MIYTEMTKKAMRIAFYAHKEQVDKTGMPYIYHPFHLAEQMHDEVSVCAALLHDTVEDTEITFDELTAQGMTDEIVEVVRLLTHVDGISYMDYVRAIKESGNATAIAIKLADLYHNSDVSRIGKIDKETAACLEEYKLAIGLLRNAS